MIKTRPSELHRLLEHDVHEGADYDAVHKTLSLPSNAAELSAEGIRSRKFR